MSRHRRLLLFGTFAAVAGLIAPSAPAVADGKGHRDNKINHIVVIYEENHSFDNLYGLWGSVNGQEVNGVPQATLGHTVQVDQNGTAYTCLLQNDVNLTVPPLTVQCIDPNPAVGQSHFINLPFNIDTYIPPTATTCPPPGVFAARGVKNGEGLPGGCTEDIVHRFYQEQYQINDGQQNRYVTGSDSVGMTMGYYDTTQLPIYQYLHSAGAPNYIVADNFFQGGFGGSFLNHQVLVAAQPPVFVNADRSGVGPGAPLNGCATGTTNCDLHSVVDSNGFPNSTYPLYKPTSTVVDAQLTEAAGEDGSCTPTFPGAVAAPEGTLCGDWVVNTSQPFTQPFAPNTALGRRVPLLASDNIGDQMTARNVSWAWYSGGWDNAAGNNGRDAMHPLGPGWTNGPTNTSTGTCAAGPDHIVNTGAVFPNCPDALFQFHHQPLSYFANYADGTQGRLDHLKDEEQFMTDAQNGTLPQVSFVKPVGDENEHPGYASEPEGSQHLVDLIKTITEGPNGDDTMIIVTYDEFGGSWDHVSPPGTDGQAGPHDVYGPGTRIPALIVSSRLRASGVDHEQYDTTSILATIERQFNVKPLTDFTTGRHTRDARVNNLLHVFDRR